MKQKNFVALPRGEEIGFWVEWKVCTVQQVFYLLSPGEVDRTKGILSLGFMSENGFFFCWIKKLLLLLLVVILFFLNHFGEEKKEY